MARINWTRALIGGLLAGMIWGTLYAPVHPLVEAHDPTGRPILPLTPFEGDTLLMQGFVVANGFLQGILTVLLYAAIRPRIGPGPITAAVAGLSVWFLSSWVHLVWVVFTGASLTAALVPLLVNLPLVVVSGMASAWLYKEDRRADPGTDSAGEPPSLCPSTRWARR